MDNFRSDEEERCENDLDLYLQEIYPIGDHVDNFIDASFRNENTTANHNELEDFSNNFFENFFAPEVVNNPNRLVSPNSEGELTVYQSRGNDRNLDGSFYGENSRQNQINNVNNVELENFSDNYIENDFARNLMANPISFVDSIEDYDFNRIEGGQSNVEVDNCETFLNSLNYLKFNSVKNVQRFKDRFFKYTSQAVISENASESCFDDVCNEIADFVRESK